MKRHAFNSRDDWLAARREFIGGSDLTKLLTGDYGGPLAVWTAKVKGDDSLARAGEAARWGSLVEPALSTIYAERHPRWTVSDPGDYVLYTSDEWPHIAVTFDRLVREGDPFSAWSAQWPLELKTAGQWDGWGPEGTHPHGRYVFQCWAQAAVCGAQHVDMMAHVAGQLREYRVPFDRHRWTDVYELVVQWWHDFVQRRTPPPPLDDATIDAWRDYLNTLRVESLPTETREATETEAAVITAAEWWKRCERGAAEQRAHFDAQLRNLLIESGARRLNTPYLSATYTRAGRVVIRQRRS